MDTTLEAEVIQILMERGLTIATAESCTGGLIAHRLTNIPGCSAAVMGALVAYSNGVKQRVANVAEQTLMQHGAVSGQTAIELARGARRLFQVDVAVSVTGIAGPGGATKDKPVGLTYIGVVAEGYEQVARHVWPSDRLGNKDLSADVGLRMVLAYLGRPRAEVEATSAAEVESSLLDDGRVAPRAFTWQGKRVAIASTGRQWVEGDRRHVLVQTGAGETYELSVQMPAMHWTVKPVGHRSSVA